MAAWRENAIISYRAREIKGGKAALIFQIGSRQFSRLVAKHEEGGVEALERKKRVYKKKYSEEERQEIIRLYKTKYYDCNFVQFLEFLEKNEGLKIRIHLFTNYFLKMEFYHRIHTEKLSNLIKRVKQDSTTNTKKISDNSSQNNSNIFSTEKPRNRVNTPRRFGWIVEFDTSEVTLSNGEVRTLRLDVDIGTSTLVGAYFDKVETLNGYLRALYQTMENQK